jgi:hypothetical protein
MNPYDFWDVPDDCYDVDLFTFRMRIPANVYWAERAELRAKEEQKVRRIVAKCREKTKKT